MAVTITGSSLAFGSGAVAALTVPLGTAPLYAARAWVNFDGTVPGIRSAGNVSSITDNGVGDYTVNFTTPMHDANYSFLGTCGSSSGSGANRIVAESPGGSSTRTASALRIGVGIGGSASLYDVTFVNVAIFR